MNLSIVALVLVAIIAFLEAVAIIELSRLRQRRLATLDFIDNEYRAAVEGLREMVSCYPSPYEEALSELLFDRTRPRSERCWPGVSVEALKKHIPPSDEWPPSVRRNNGGIDTEQAQLATLEKLDQLYYESMVKG